MLPMCSCRVIWDQVWHRLGLYRKFIIFEGEIVVSESEPESVNVDDDEVASDLSIDPDSRVSEEAE